MYKRQASKENDTPEELPLSRNKPTMIYPRIMKTDKSQASRKKVTTTPIIVPSIIQSKPISSDDKQPTETERRSTRLRKPPDKLRY